MNIQIWQKYLGKLDNKKRKIILDILGIIKNNVPNSEETMPYGVPGFKLNSKNLIAVAAHKNHLGIYPFSPSVVKQIEPFLKNVDTTEGTIRFNYNCLPDGAMIKQILDLRVAEIKS